MPAERAFNQSKDIFSCQFSVILVCLNKCVMFLFLLIRFAAFNNALKNDQDAGFVAIFQRERYSLYTKLCDMAQLINRIFQFHCIFVVIGVLIKILFAHILDIRQFYCPTDCQDIS